MLKKSDQIVEKKTRLKFQGRKRSKTGILSMMLFMVVFAGFLTASIISWKADGNAGIVVGYIGLGCLAVAVLGFVLGVRSLRERDILYFHPVFGLVANSIMMIALVALYLTGILL